MVQLPNDIINYICKLASYNSKWYPSFCPQTNKLSWKVNKKNKKLILDTKIIYHKSIYNSNYFNVPINLQTYGNVSSFIGNCFIISREIVNDEYGTHMLRCYLISFDDYGITHRVMIKPRLSFSNGGMFAGDQHIYAGSTIYALVYNFGVEIDDNGQFSEFNINASLF